MKKENRLRDELERLAVAGGCVRPQEAANWMLRRILLNIDGAQSRKLREWKSNNVFREWEANQSNFSEEWAFHLVKIEQGVLENEELPLNRRSNQEVIIKRAAAKKNSDVNALGKRAVALLLGAKRKPTRAQGHPVESKAVAIVEKIKAEWHPAAKAGRPPDGATSTHFKQNEIFNQVWVAEPRLVRLTYEEVVSTALPSLLNLGPDQRTLSAEIMFALEKLMWKLDSEMVGGRSRDKQKVSDSIEEIAKQYVRKIGPLSKYTAMSDYEERQYLKGKSA
jgi:hypothetical protein